MATSDKFKVGMCVWAQFKAGGRWHLRVIVNHNIRYPHLWQVGIVRGVTRYGRWMWNSELRRRDPMLSGQDYPNA